jgi:hypothetical protein
VLLAHFTPLGSRGSGGGGGGGSGRACSRSTRVCQVREGTDVGINGVISGLGRRRLAALSEGSHHLKRELAWWGQ